jgi:hypothetical protein
VKFRHAAALALAGWYLMLPRAKPSTLTGKTEVDSTSPLANWSIGQSFDSASACERMRDYAGKQGAAREAKVPVCSSSKGRILVETSAVQAENAVCVAADDPRLKEK